MLGYIRCSNTLTADTSRVLDGCIQSSDQVLSSGLAFSTLTVFG